MDAAAQMLGNIQLALHKGTIDDQLRGLIREACSLPGLDLLPHRLEVPLHAVHFDGEDPHEARCLVCLVLRFINTVSYYEVIFGGAI